MARWKLVNPHYLNVEDNEWEYKEIDRSTGKEKRMRIQVPMLLDPRDPDAWTSRWGNNSNADGEIIVCHKGKGEDKDIVFFGDPTPDMVPVDDEAKEISASFEEHWRYKPEGLPGDYSQSLIDQFQSEMSEAITKPVQVEGLSELVGAISEMVKTNQQILAKQRPV